MKASTIGSTDNSNSFSLRSITVGVSSIRHTSLSRMCSGGGAYVGWYVCPVRESVHLPCVERSMSLPPSGRKDRGDGGEPSRHQHACTCVSFPPSCRGWERWGRRRSSLAGKGGVGEGGFPPATSPCAHAWGAAPRHTIASVALTRCVCERVGVWVWGAAPSEREFLDELHRAVEHHDGVGAKGGVAPIIQDSARLRLRVRVRDRGGSGGRVKGEGDVRGHGLASGVG